MTQAESKLQRTYKCIKDNIQFIVLLPAILGGFWQILELSSMSLSFIRFFSVTQVVSDGLMILFVVLVIYAVRVLVRPAFNLKKSNDIETLPSNLISWKTLGIVLFYIVCGIFLGFLIIREFITSKSMELGSLVILIAILTICVDGINHHFQIHNIYPSIKDFFRRKEKIIFYSAIIFFLVVVYLLPSFYTAVGYFRSTYLIPKNFKNLHNIDCVLINEHNIAIESANIQYFNDKYVFVKYGEPGIEKFVILEFDVLTRLSDCK